MLLEREHELAEIAGLIDAAVRRSGGVLLVEGPAGIGKTALLRAGAELANGKVPRLLTARGSPLEQEFPYGLVRQLIDPLLESLPEPERDRALEGAAALASPALTSTSQPLRAPPSLDRSSSTLHGLYWLTANLAASGPLIMVVDDIHWADAASLRFLAYLAGRLEGLPVAVIAAIRTGDPGEWAAAVAELNDPSVAQVVRPSALSATSVGLLLEDESGGTPDSALVTAVHEATGGNPFLAREVGAALEADGLLLRGDAVDRVRTLGPRTVSRSIMVRAARVGPEAAPVLRAVAVLGERADLRHVTRLAGVEEGVAAAAAGELVRCGLLGDGLPLGFAHPVLRSTVYEDITAAERADWHRRAATLLAEADAPIDVVAGHLLLTEPSGDEQVVDALRAAASAAFTSGAAETARAYLRRALTEPVHSEARPAVLHELATAETLLSDPAAVAHLQEAHAIATDPTQRARYAHDLAALLGYAGRWSDAVDVMAAAIAELGERDEAMHLRLTALQVAPSLDPRHAAELDRRLPEFLNLARRSAPEARALRLHLALTLVCRGEQCDLVPELVAAGLDGGDFVAQEGSDSLAAAQSVHALVYIDELDWGRSVAETLLSAAQRSGSVLGFAAGSGLRALVSLRAGALLDVEADARAAVELTFQHELFLIAPFVAAYLAEALIERGDSAEAGRLLTAVTLPDHFARMPQGARLAEATARVLRDQGDHARAIDSWRAAGEISEGCGIHNPSISSWRSELALALALDDPPAARKLVDDELVRARRANSTRAAAIALRARGMLGGGDGLEDLAAASAMLERTPAKLELARALLELGAALRRANRRADGREPLRRARELAQRCGALKLVERAETELLATGARPRRLAVSGIEALTPSERRVAQLAVTGLSSPQIAQQLFVTVNTIESHLRHAYQKLDIHSRQELTQALSTSP